MKTFSINEALSAGWALFKGRVGFFISLLLLWGVLIYLPQMAIKNMETVWLQIVFAIVLQLFQYFLAIGILKITLMIADGKPVAIGDLFSGGPQFTPYVLASILYTLAVLVGLVLLVVPGIMVAIVFGYYGYFIIDKGMGPVDALKASAALTKGVRWKLLGFGLVMIILNAVGGLLVGLGLFVTVPVSLVAVAVVYRRLMAQTAYPEFSP